MLKQLKNVVLFGVPLVIGVLNLSHPLVKPPVYDGILPHLSWWITLHLLNLILFPLLGLAAYLLLKDVSNIAAIVSRIALGVYVPTYAAFDALAGIATGILVQNAQHLTPLQGNHFDSLIDAYWNSNVINALAAIGSIAWVIAMIAAAVACTDADRRRLAGLAAVILFFVGGWAQTNLFLPSLGGTIPLTWWLIAVGIGLSMLIVAKPRIPAALLVLSGVFFGASHVSPTGPLGMLCFIGAVTCREVRTRRLPRNS